MLSVLLLISGGIIGAGILYFCLKPRLKIVQFSNEEAQKKNEQLQIEYNQLIQEQAVLISKRNDLVNNIDYLNQQLETTKKQVEAFQDQANFLKEQTIEFQRQAEESSNTIYEKSYALANEKMDQAAEVMSHKYREMEEVFKKDYLNTLEDCVNSFQEKIVSKQAELAEIDAKLNDLTAKLTSAVEAAKRAEELRLKQDYYRLQLSAVDVDEIKRLREVTPYLRDSEPLNKVIWKVYYEKPYTDLIGRVIGNGTHTGIYKITNIENQMCYIGQAANLADRWKQHIKRGIGAETPTRNKLYPAMLEIGVENFTFEVVEECDRVLLNEREDYWQDYFHAKEFGYSIK